MTILIISRELSSGEWGIYSNHRIFWDGKEVANNYLDKGEVAYQYHQKLEAHSLAVSHWKPGEGPDPLDTPML